MGWRQEPVIALTATRSKLGVALMSVMVRISDLTRTLRDVRFVPIVLQKSFCVLDHKISER
jgi:hypothetical protein